MKILLVERLYYSFGGTQRYVLNQAELLAKKGHGVMLFDGKRLLTPQQAANSDFNSPNWTIADKLQAVYSPSSLWKLRKILKTTKPDLVHFHNINFSITSSAIHASILESVPAVATIHDSRLLFPGSFESRVQRNALFSVFGVGALIVSNEYYRRQIRDTGTLKPIFVIPPFSFKAGKMKTKGPERKKLPRRIIYFGRLTEKKGLSKLINAVSGLPIGVSIVGKGPLTDRLIAVSAQNNNVRVYGFMKYRSLASFISRHDAIVLPSDVLENSPMSIVEAFSLGKPVIAPRAGGIPEMVEDEVNGLLFIHRSVASLRNSIIKFIKMDEEMLEQMGENANLSYRRRYTPQQYYDRLMSLYMAIRRSY